VPSSLKFMEHFKNGHIWPSVSGPALLVFQAAAQELWMACTQFSIHLLPQFCEACLLRIVKEIPFGILWATSAAHKKTSQQLRPHGIWHFCQNAQRRISVKIWANLSDLLEIPSSEQHKKAPLVGSIELKPQGGYATNVSWRPHRVLVEHLPYRIIMNE
jgi:hypothetical protein